MFAYESSKVDWCEDNYQFHPYIAEFFNTFSNVLFFLIGARASVLYAKNTRFREINILLLSLNVIAFFSMYFHATLSLFGQLMDEISILYFMISILFFYSDTPFNAVFLYFNLSGVFLGFVYPQINAFLLFLFLVPSVWVIINRINRTGDIQIKRLGIGSLISGLTAVSVWILDKFTCKIWKPLLGFYPQFHAIWHLLICISAFWSIAFVMRSKHQKGEIVYEIGIPFSISVE